MSSPHRETRREANNASSAFFAQYNDKFDEIYDEQVKIRTSIAKKQGYDNFIQLDYDRLNRSDYNAEMVQNFRAQVKKFIVPLAETENTVPENAFPTLEAAEIHSHTMELLTWPWMELFFQEDADKYRFFNLSGNIFLLLGCCIGDEFQHFVYENRDATPAERREKWRSLEKEYLPSRHYLDNPYLENGGAWHRILHLFMRPFYYIDYALAVTCAQQLWKRSRTDMKSTRADYLKLCQLGGSKSFLELVKETNLISPFADGCMEFIGGDINGSFASVDDSKF